VNLSFLSGVVCMYTRTGLKHVGEINCKNQNTQKKASNTRGHSLKLHKSSIHTELRQHFFTERVINLWNSLDEESASAVSVNSFKGKLQKLHTNGSFSRLLKSTWPLGLSQISGEALTGRYDHGYLFPFDSAEAVVASAATAMSPVVPMLSRTCTNNWLVVIFDHTTRWQRLPVGSYRQHATWSIESWTFGSTDGRRWDCSYYRRWHILRVMQQWICCCMVDIGLWAAISRHFVQSRTWKMHHIHFIYHI